MTFICLFARICWPPLARLSSPANRPISCFKATIRSLQTPVIPNPVYLTPFFFFSGTLFMAAILIPSLFLYTV